MQTQVTTQTKPNQLRHIVRYLVGLVTALVGSADMLSAIVPRLETGFLSGAWPIASHRVPAQTFIVVIGFFLLVLSYGLARGKHHAWRITLVLLLLSALLHIQRSGSIIATFTALTLATTLYVLERFFQAKSDPPSARRGYIALFLGLGIVIFYTIGGFIALYNDFEPWIDRIGVDGVLIRIAHGTLHLPHGTRAIFFQHALPVLCISAILYGMAQIFRPVAAVLLPAKEERRQVNFLTQHYGTNSISYFALSEEKSYFFSTSHNCVISYVLQGSTAVVAGDPIGPENALHDAIQQFVSFCQEQDWTIVFWQVRKEIACIYRSMGLRLLKIGEDAIVNPQTFTLKGNAMSNVRSSAKRAEKDGVHVVIYRGQVTDLTQLEQMDLISRYWLTSKGGSEMGFSMGHFTPQGDEEQLYALAVDTNNKVHAFVSFIPIYGRYGWGLDLMRRAEHCAPGTMELLLARTIEYMKNLGAQMASLGLAPLSNANEEDETFLGTSIDFLTERFGNPSKNQSLFNFKKKFHPTWESRYLVYSDALSLPKIGWALYMAHQPDMSLIGTLRQTLIEWQHNRKLLQEQNASQALHTAKA
ncbi:MAG TPA: phosphatidylglycerol lysyltransferase domain-containing protein [Dictyobacter sp.]|jgi:phosphatidylglycerol lysyltransferase|nr:phosphatidylglycerol lysyltransferase domain-containing protein [Dictyobacter sp.]